MIKHLSTLLLLCTSAQSFALKSDANQPAHITADAVQYSNKTGIAKYLGHVHAVQGSTIIDADEITLYRNEHNDIEKIVAIGKSAHYSTQGDEQSERFHASGYTIVYFPAQAKVHLIKHGLAIIGKNRFSGPSLRYDMNEQLVESDPSPEGQTTIVLEPRVNKPPSKTKQS